MLDAEVLKTAIKARMATNGFVLANGSAAQFVDILCEEIITHFAAQVLLVYVPGTPPIPTGEIVMFVPAP